MLDTKKVQARIADIASSFKAYIELSQKDRTKITKGDKRRISELERDLKRILEPEEVSDLTVDVATVAKFFGITIRQVQNWVKEKGCPKLKHGLYDLKAVLDWWLENIIGVDTKEIEDAKLKYWTWKAEAEKIRVEQAKAELISEAEIVQEWSARMSEVTTGLQALSRRLPPLIDGKSKVEQQIIVENEIWKLRDNYCRAGQFCPPVDSE